MNLIKIILINIAPFNYSLKTSFLIQEDEKNVIVFDFWGDTYDASLTLNNLIKSMEILTLIILLIIS